MKTLVFTNEELALLRQAMAGLAQHKGGMAKFAREVGRAEYADVLDREAGAAAQLHIRLLKVSEEVF